VGAGGRSTTHRRLKRRRRSPRTTRTAEWPGAPLSAAPLRDAHAHQDWTRPFHVYIGTGFTMPHLRRDRGPPLPHLHRDWANLSQVCTGTGPTPPTSAPGLGQLSTPRTSAPSTGCSARAGRRKLGDYQEGHGTGRRIAWHWAAWHGAGPHGMALGRMCWLAGGSSATTKRRCTTTRTRSSSTPRTARSCAPAFSRRICGGPHRPLATSAYAAELAYCRRYNRGLVFYDLGEYLKALEDYTSAIK
jgi:hypothetical protein